MVYEMSARGSLNEVWHSRWLQLLTGMDYVFRRRGMLTFGAGVVGVFTKSTMSVDIPDIQFHFIPLSGEGPGKGLHKFRIGVSASSGEPRLAANNFARPGS
jgi:choline dehydrogenase